MTNKDQKIKAEVEMTMSLLETKTAIKTDPYFYQRLEARINNQANRKSSIIDRNHLTAALIPAFCLLMVLVNMASAFWALNSDIQSGYNRDTYLTAFAEDYTPTSYHASYLTMNELGE